MNKGLSHVLCSYYPLTVYAISLDITIPFKMTKFNRFIAFFKQIQLNLQIVHAI